MKTRTIIRTGQYDHWQREIVRDGSGIHYVLVEGVPHHTTKTGEPTFPLRDFVFQDLGKPRTFDSNDYPYGFDPMLYDLEKEQIKKPKEKNMLKL
ncbi:MAG: hypothetical protein Tsb004_19950 [Allomuricauda sp.]